MLYDLQPRVWEAVQAKNTYFTFLEHSNDEVIPAFEFDSLSVAWEENGYRVNKVYYLAPFRNRDCFNMWCKYINKFMSLRLHQSPQVTANLQWSSVCPFNRDIYSRRCSGSHRIWKVPVETLSPHRTVMGKNPKKKKKNTCRRVFTFRFSTSLMYCSASVRADRRRHGDDDPQHPEPPAALWVEAAQLSSGYDNSGKVSSERIHSTVGPFWDAWKCFFASGGVRRNVFRFAYMGEHGWQLWQKTGEYHMRVKMHVSSLTCTAVHPSRFFWCEFLRYHL